MFNPGMTVNIGMQGMAFVSGQYYLNQINDKLDKLGSKVDEIKELQEAEKKAL